MKTPDTNDDAVQEEILRAALRLYKKYGPNKVTMDDVAAASGRSRTSLYYYYKNRDEIYQAVMDTVASDVAREIRQAVAAALTLEDRMYAFCNAKLRSSESWKSVFTAMWSSMDSDEQTSHSRTMSALHGKLLHHEGLILKEIMTAAAAAGQARSLDAAQQEKLAFVISSGVRGLRSELVNHQAAAGDIDAATRLFAHMAAKWLEG